MGKGASVAALVAAWTVIAVAPAHAATAGQIVALLNAERAIAGLPADATETLAWSRACAMHNVYQQAHGRVLSHGEPDVAHPTYSPEGDAVSRGAVLSVGSSWDRGNPFVDAPIHLHQLLVPRLSATGADERDGRGCATTFGPPPGAPGYARPAPATPVIYTVPRDRATGFDGSQIAREGPFTAGELLGIPPGTETGRYLMVFVDGPWSTPLPPIDVTAATLRPAGGQPVELKIADAGVATPDGRTLGDYLPEGPHLIPVKPLAPGTTYEASVALMVQGIPLTRTWTFTTAPAAPAVLATSTAPASLPRLTIDRARYRDGRLRFTVRAGKPLAGRRASVTITIRGRRPQRRSLRLAATRTLTVRARRATVTVRVAAFTAGGTRYGPIRVSRSGAATPVR